MMGRVFDGGNENKARFLLCFEPWFPSIFFMHSANLGLVLNCTIPRAVLPAGSSTRLVLPQKCQTSWGGLGKKKKKTCKL